MAIAVLIVLSDDDLARGVVRGARQRLMLIVGHAEHVTFFVIFKASVVSMVHAVFAHLESFKIVVLDLVPVFQVFVD